MHNTLIRSCHSSIFQEVAEKQHISMHLLITYSKIYISQRSCMHSHKLNIWSLSKMHTHAKTLSLDIAFLGKENQKYSTISVHQEAFLTMYSKNYIKQGLTCVHNGEEMSWLYVGVKKKKERARQLFLHCSNSSNRAMYKPSDTIQAHMDCINKKKQSAMTG